MPVFNKAIQRYINKATSAKSKVTTALPGISVTVIEGDHLPHNLVSGVRSIQTNAPVTPDDLFETGSSTKTYTATILLLLTEQNKLKITDTIAEVIERCPDNIYKHQLQQLVKQFSLGAITLHQLLNHTSGLKEYETTKAYTDTLAFDRYYKWSMVQLIEMAAKEKLGPKAFHYADTNFTLLGLIAQAVENKPYNEILKSAIVYQLGLEQIYYLPVDQDKIKNRLVNGYEWYSPSTKQPEEDYQAFIAQAPATPQIANYRNSGDVLLDVTLATDPSWGGLADGGVVTNMQNAAEFFRALLKGKILRYETLEAMLGGKDHEGLVIATNEGFKDVVVKYGLGIYYFEAPNGVKFWGMMGDELGYHGGALYFPRQGSLKKDITISYGFNLDSPDFLESFILELIKWIDLKNRAEEILDHFSKFYFTLDGFMQYVKDLDSVESKLIWMDEVFTTVTQEAFADETSSCLSFFYSPDCSLDSEYENNLAILKKAYLMVAAEIASQTKDTYLFSVIRESAMYNSGALFAQKIERELNSSSICKVNPPSMKLSP